MIDKSSKEPIYVQIADYIKRQIENSEFTAGEIVPSENVLSKKYNVSRMTIRHAIDTLVNEGYLYRKRGKGTFVADFKIEHNAYRLKGFTEEILQFNKKPNNKVTKFEIKPADEEISKKLKINIDELVYLIERLRCVDDEAVIFEISYMPVELFPDLSIKDLRGSKYSYVEKTVKYKIKESTQEIIPEIVEEPVKTQLHMKENTPILRVKSTTILDNGVTFEYSETYFKTGRYKFMQKSSRF